MDAQLEEDLVAMGIASPVTKATAGALYHQELSRQARRSTRGYGALEIAGPSVCCHDMHEVLHLRLCWRLQVLQFVVMMCMRCCTGAARGKHDAAAGYVLPTQAAPSRSFHPAVLFALQMSSCADPVRGGAAGGLPAAAHRARGRHNAAAGCVLPVQPRARLRAGLAG